jgi:hypothetical protein
LSEKVADAAGKKLFDQLIKWFAGCWESAGGRNLACPSSIVVHDDTDRYNLKTKKWESAFADDEDDDDIDFDWD